MTDPSKLEDSKSTASLESTAFERSEAYMAEVERLSHTGSWRFNTRTGETFWSKEFFSILGFDSERTKPSYSLFFERIHPDDRARCERVGSAAIEANEDYNFEFRLLLPGGLVKYMHTVGRYLPSQSGEAEFIAVVTDITERKRAREELRRSEAFVAEGQHLSGTGSFSWRVATEEIVWSEQMYRIFEFDQNTPVTIDMIGSRVHPDDVPLFKAMTSRARGSRDDFDYDYEYRLLLPDGSVKYLHVIAHGTRDEHGRLEYIGAAQDVTQRRLSEEALAKARAELAHVTRVTSLGVLTASIAHEVNQPLATIVTNGESSLRWLARGEPNIERVRVLTKNMVADAQRASDIIERIRDVASKRAPEQKPLSIDEIIKESLSFLRHELQLKGVFVSLDLARKLPRIVGDRIQLQQVFVNLTLNAVQAMALSEPAARAISVRAQHSAAETVYCSIEDGGPGIDPDDLRRLFDSFFTTKDTGMGMGLAICRSIVEAHGGNIRADNDSALGGARFIVEFPAAQESC